MVLHAKQLVIVETQERAAYLGYPWFNSGFGLLLCEEDGARCALMCGLDYAQFVATAADGSGVVQGDLDLPLEKFPFRWEGWPPGF